MGTPATDLVSPIAGLVASGLIPPAAVSAEDAAWAQAEDAGRPLGERLEAAASVGPEVLAEILTTYATAMPSWRDEAVREGLARMALGDAALRSRLDEACAAMADLATVGTPSEQLEGVATVHLEAAVKVRILHA